LRVGLLTAVLSPLVNCVFFQMPPMTELPIIMTKSVLLASAAAFAAHRFGKVSILALLLVVLAYQFVGVLVEWAMVKNFFIAIQDFRIGIPGMLVQIIGGYALLKLIAKI